MHLVMLSDVFLVYETKFTARKSQLGLGGLHCREEERSLEEIRHLGGGNPQEMSR